MQGGLQVSGSCVIGNGCAITGQLTVNGTNILDQLSEFQASTGASTIADVTGLQAALDSKNGLLTSSSTLQLSELTCSLLRPASGQTLRLADSGGTERLGLTSNSAVFSAPVSAPSLDCSGSVTCGSSLLTPIMYLAGVDLSTILTGKQDVLTTSSNLSVAAVTIAGVNIATALNGKQATITSATALSASSLTTAAASSMNGLRITGGQGFQGTGANLQVCGTGDSVNNTSAVFWGTSSANTMVWELSHLGFNHFYRTSGTASWLQTMGISLSTGGWTWYRSFGQASDQSLKDNIQDANTEQCLNMLRQVSAKTYTRKDLTNDGSRLGFVAQDVEAACDPLWDNLVSTSTYKWTEAPEGAEIKVLDYARLTSVLWQCTRSLLVRVEALEARLQ